MIAVVRRELKVIHMDLDVYRNQRRRNVSVMLIVQVTKIALITLVEIFAQLTTNVAKMRCVSLRITFVNANVAPGSLETLWKHVDRSLIV